ncbi:mitochondrial 54S ribosomal protein YmL11 [Starmerella bacillaris]|uniref:Mitochondrial 54S ribosomal protein YmL11 n=1 Tax=Starmerella bacillaris TaxID=1247836 RepID=A0AAV5RH76_STABA|nr:mitochondrial 54S ribosomal protein YmL11 [Starmerella bacillaris]
MQKYAGRKAYLLSTYKRLLTENNVVLALQNSTLVDEEDRKLRLDLKKAGAQFTVVRSSILRVALRQEDQINNNTEQKNIKAVPVPSSFSQLFKGPTAVVSLRDLEPTQLKSVVSIIDKLSPKLVLLAGVVNGEDKVLFRKELDRLKELPSLPILRAQLTSLLQMAGGQRIVQTLQQPAQTLASDLSRRE